MMIGRAVLSVAVVLCWAAPGAAQDGGEQSAEPSANDVQARTLFQAGQTYYRQGEYELARQQFEQAYRLSPRPELLLNASVAAERAGELEPAIDLLVRYLEEADNVLAEERANLERRLEAMQLRLERKCAGEPEPQDDAAQESSTAGDATTPPPAVGGSEAGGVPVPAIVAWSVGGVGVLAFGIFGTLTLLEDSSLADGCGATTSCSEDDLSSLHTFGLLADVGLIVGLAGAVTGTILWLASGSPEDDSVAVAPWLGPGSAGTTVRGSF